MQQLAAGLKIEVRDSEWRIKRIVSLDGASRTKDPVELELRRSNERALFHFVAARAVRRLFLSDFGEPSEYLVQSNSSQEKYEEWR